MPRYILIDNHSGYIFGDTAEARSPHTNALAPVDAAQWVDETQVGVYDRSYEIVDKLASNETGYCVYQAADDNGKICSWHGRDQELIEAVQRDCKLIATIRCVDPD